MYMSYEIIKSFNFNEHFINSPIQLEKGNLLLDNVKSQLVFQLKLRNTSGNKIISSVCIYVDYYDDAGSLIHTNQEISYLGLNCKPKETFGSDKAILLSDNSIRDLRVKRSKIMFSDATVEEFDIQTVKIPSSKQ